MIGYRSPHLDLGMSLSMPAALYRPRVVNGSTRFIKMIDYFGGSRPNCIEKAILKDTTSQMPGQITALQNQKKRRKKKKDGAQL